MPYLFWLLLVGSVSYVGGLFSSEALGRTVKIGIAVLMAFWLYNIVTKRK